MRTDLERFQMPRYREIPAIGLFLEQTVKYINTALEPLGCMEITSSMVSNYVKKGYVKGPVKKQYDAESIAQLLFVTVAKSVLSMDNIKTMFDYQQKDYPIDKAYNYFCDVLEDSVFTHFGMREASTEIESTDNLIGMMRSVTIAASHIIYLHDKFEELEGEQ